MDDRPIDVEWLLAQGAWMRALARSLIADRGLAEDVVQDAYAAALARGPRDGRHGRPWLAAVVGNLARRSRGREARRNAIERRETGTEPPVSAADLVARMELQRRLAEAVLALDEPYRSAVLWRHVADLGAAEIARRQGCTSEAARQRVARGVERLRQALDARFGERSAWALALAPLAGRAPSVFLPVATALGGLAMGSKAIGFALAAAAGAVLAFLAWPERGRPAPDASPASARGTAVAVEDSGRANELAAPDPGAREARTPAKETRAAAAALVLVGRVHDRAGRPLEGASVVLAASEADAREIVARGLPDVRRAMADETGAFRLPLSGDRSETRVLWATLAGYLAARLETDGSEPLDVLLHARPALEIVLLAPEGVDRFSPTTARVWVRRDDGAEEDLGVLPDADGRLVARDLPLGRAVRVQARRRGAAGAERALDLVLVPDAYERVVLELLPGATVSGVVLDARTGAAIPGADVWAEEGWLEEQGVAPVARADADGRFTLAGVDVVPVTGDAERVWCLVAAGADGFVGQRFEAHSWPADVRQRYWIELRLVPASARLEGRVVLPDPRGAPVRVFAVDARAELHIRIADDRFTLEDLTAGRLDLFLATREDAPEEARAALRTTVELDEGEERTVELRLESGRGVVRGRLIDPAGAPVAGATVALNHNMIATRLAFPAEHRERTTDAAGGFEFAGAFPGRYHLRIVGLPRDLCVEPFEDDVVLAEGELFEIELRCASPIELAGRVDLAGRDPTTLLVVARTAEHGAELATSIVAADGAFLFPRLYPAEIELRLLSGQTELGRTVVEARSARDVVLTAGGG